MTTEEERIQGHCVEPRADQMLWLKPGEYGKDLVDGFWYARPPGDVHGLVANLGSHIVTQHEDGTITASPSIAVTGSDNKGARVRWHGYLEAGMWRDA